MTSSTIAVYGALSADYEHAFSVFLAHTDQKDKARAWMDRTIAGLPSRRTFIDVGAGNGKVTAWHVPQFERTIAIEPNPHLREHLAETCPTATVLPDLVLEASPPGRGDLVLVSHVFYYIPEEEWLAHLERVASFVEPGGLLVVVLQNARTDCMRLLERFHGRRFDIQALGRRFEAAHSTEFACDVETVACRIDAPDLPTASTIAEFMLNLLPMPVPPLRSDVEAFLAREFAAPSGGYCLSCSQDFLQIRRRSNP